MNRSIEELVKLLKKRYPAGTRIKLISMEDPYAPIPSGTNGTVRIVDSIGTIHVDWDNGRRLGLIPWENSFEVLTDE